MHTALPSLLKSPKAWEHDHDALTQAWKPNPKSRLPAASTQWAYSPPPPRLAPHLSQAQMQPWLDAARNFEMNIDFDIASELGEAQLPLHILMNIMKEQSRGKCTIQVIGDKILLHGILLNLGIQEMPLLFSSHGAIDKDEVHHLVEGLESSDDPEAFDIVAKPTHLSNSAGTLVLTNETWDSCGYNADTLADHMQTFLSQRASETESAALQSLVPGFIVQPCYKSSVDYGYPIEVRVVTLWGKTRVGIFWCGGGDKKNAWIVQQDKYSRWEVVHENPCRNSEYEQALAIMVQAMPTMAKVAERIAVAVGTPFLRSDFFVGSSKWGICLNEVAYGSNIELRHLSRSAPYYVDDSAAVARILQEGYKHCIRRSPEYFLRRLGVHGDTYEPEVPWWNFWDKRVPGINVQRRPLTRPI